MQVNIRLEGMDKVREELANLSGPRFQQAVATTLNQVAGRYAKNMRAEMAKVFDRPRPYTLRSVVVKQATSAKLEATVQPTYMGGKGIDPQQYLKAQADGGVRSDKRSEKALRTAGILPSGYYLAIPKDPFPGSEDGYGNLKGSFVVQLLSYFKAFAEQGYRANMTDKRRAKLADRTTYSSLNSRREMAMIRGVVFFVSYGRLRGQNLAPGIWAKTGTHGANVRPVVMFVRTPQYRVRLDMDKIARETDASGLMAKWLRGNVRDQYRAQVAEGGA
jgi:hypothetical protein